METICAECKHSKKIKMRYWDKWICRAKGHQKKLGYVTGERLEVSCFQVNTRGKCKCFERYLGPTVSDVIVGSMFLLAAAALVAITLAITLNFQITIG